MSLAQLGIGKETTYGTAVAVDKFFEFLKEDITGKYERVQSEALSSSYVNRSDRWAVLQKGAKGKISMEPLSKGFGHWLKFMLGKVTTTGPVETSCYTHKGEIDTLFGRNLTVQVGREQEDASVKPWTYDGGKVTGFEFTNKADETLRCEIEMDFAKEWNPDSPTGVYALQTLVPVTGAEVLSAAGGTIKVGATVIECSDIEIKVDNELKVDKPIIKKGASKCEPTQDGKRKISFKLTLAYKDNSLWELVSAAAASGANAVLEAKWEGLTLLGTTIYPSLTVKIPYARFDEGGPTVDGPKAVDQKISGQGLYNGTDSPIEVTYVSSDVTVLN